MKEFNLENQIHHEEILGLFRQYPHTFFLTDEIRTAYFPQRRESPPRSKAHVNNQIAQTRSLLTSHEQILSIWGTHGYVYTFNGQPNNRITPDRYLIPPEWTKRLNGYQQPVMQILYEMRHITILNQNTAIPDVTSATWGLFLLFAHEPSRPIFNDQIAEGMNLSPVSVTHELRNLSQYLGNIKHSPLLLRVDSRHGHRLMTQ
jgi:hypothetical protein